MRENLDMGTISFKKEDNSPRDESMNDMSIQGEAI
jgi:hypothetical protein